MQPRAKRLDPDWGPETSNLVRAPAHQDLNPHGTAIRNMKLATWKLEAGKLETGIVSFVIPLPPPH